MTLRAEVLASSRDLAFNVLEGVMLVGVEICDGVCDPAG